MDEAVNSGCLKEDCTGNLIRLLLKCELPWNSKFKCRKNNSRQIGGFTSNADIASCFKTFFETACTPNNKDLHDLHKNEFYKTINQYSYNEVMQFDILNISNATEKLRVGKSAGIDNVTAEHILYAHPILLTCLKMLFNIMLISGYVPNAFGQGILIPLVKDSNSDVTSCDNYRCITLSCVFSKLFEYAMLELFQCYLNTNDLQFGFKANVGCSDALYTLKNVVNYFNNHNSTVTLCALDISKAFDKVSHYKLFLKLMDRHIPKCFIHILCNWYDKCWVKVRWNESFSDTFKTTAGVRQGGVLSPYLFAIYIEDIINQLSLYKLGCQIGTSYLGCLLYADDILLLSQSVTCMQKMLNICCSIVNDLDLKFNVKKSVAMRIGNRFKNVCKSLRLVDSELDFVDTIKYLGVYIKSGRSFKLCYSNTRYKYFRCFNAVYSKSKSASSELISVNLLKSYCLPLIMYSSEAIAPNKSDMLKLDNLINVSISKIFNTYDSHLIGDIRLNLGLFSIDSIISERSYRFNARFYNKNFYFAETLFAINYSNYKKCYFVC